MQPLVSVIIPAYNAGRFLGTCLDSLIAQTYPHWEAIVVNDGSQDDTQAVLTAYEQKDPRIHAIHTPNAGVSAARNTALDASSGTYVCFCDSDDWLSDNALAVLVRHMEAQDVDVVLMNTCLHHIPSGDAPSGSVKRTVRIPSLPGGRYNKIAMIKYSMGIRGRKGQVTTCYLNVINKMFRRSVLLEDDGSLIRFPVGVRYLEDGQYLVEVLKNVRTFYFEPNCLYNQRIHDESAMHRLDVAELSDKMLDGYLGVQHSRTIEDNPIARAYARGAMLRAIRHYARRSTQEQLPHAIEAMRRRFSDDEEVLQVLDEAVLIETR